MRGVMATIKDVAKHADVSIGTVSNYLTGAKPVMPKTAEKIKASIAALDYRPNPYAKNLRNNSTREIGVVLPNTAENYYAYLLEGMESELRKAGCYLNIALTGDMPDNEISAVDSLLKKNVCGIAVMSCLRDHKFYKNIKDTSLLFIDRKVSFDEANYISFNQYETTTYLLKELYDNGYRKIALVAGPEHFSCEAAYAHAYRDFFAERGHDIEEGLIRHIHMTKEEAFRIGITLFQDFAPEAVISTSRLVTNGLEQAAYFAGVSLYNDMLMISIGEETLSSIIKYNNIIVTMRPAYYLGTRAARLLLSNISSPLMFEKQQILLQDKIIGKNLFEPIKKDIIPTQTTRKSIKVLFLDSPNAHGIIRTHAEFSRKTGIDVDVTLCDHSLLLEKLRNRDYLAEFDVCMYDNPWLDVLVEKERLLDITDFVKSKNLDNAIFLDHLLEKVGMVNGRYYGLPFLFGPQLLLYRRDLFEDPALCAAFKKKYGTNLHVPRTWFEFNVISSFFTRSINSASPVAYGTSLPSRDDVLLLPELLPRIWAYNANIFDENGEAAVTSIDFKKGVNNFIEAFKFAPADTLSYSVEDSIQSFYAGETAMLMSYAAFIVDVNNNINSKIAGKIGYANIPGNHSVLGSWGLAVPATSEDPSAALQFLLWTSDVEMSRYFTILDGQSPLKNVYTNDELATHYPWLPLIYKTYAGNVQRKSIKGKDGSLISITLVEALIYQYIMKILRDGESVDNMMAKLSDDLNKMVNS